MPAAIDHAHAALAELLFELILAQLLGFERRVLRGLVESGHRQREQQNDSTLLAASKPNRLQKARRKM